MEGQWNYAYYEEHDAYYFLEKITSHDVAENVHTYSMVRDLSYELVKCKDLVINGELNRTSDEGVMDANIDLFIPLIDLSLIHI